MTAGHQIKFVQIIWVIRQNFDSKMYHIIEQFSDIFLQISLLCVAYMATYDLYHLVV